MERVKYVIYGLLIVGVYLLIFLLPRSQLTNAVIITACGSGFIVEMSRIINDRMIRAIVFIIAEVVLCVLVIHFV